jgi:alpha,alpha-trehalase
MKCFFSLTSSDGKVPGCVTPAGASSTLAHAKPVLIWGAFLAAEAMGDWGQFQEFAPQMRALLAYWQRERMVNGVFVWHDTMESGADDLPYAAVPSKHTASWSDADARRVSLPDVHTFLILEHRAMARFCRAWADGASPEGAAALKEEARHYESVACIISDSLNKKLWHWMPPSGETDAPTASGARRGLFVGFDAKDEVQLLNRTYQAAWPCWAGVADDTRRDAALNELLEPDMRAAHGIRSTSTLDSRFHLIDVIVPYSNWRGPVWINVNVVLAYTLASAGRREEALKLANELTDMLALDIKTNGVMHECYHPDEGTPLSSESKGFLSWNVLVATLLDNLEAEVDPFRSITNPDSI